MHIEIKAIVAIRKERRFFPITFLFIIIYRLTELLEWFVSSICMHDGVDDGARVDG